MFLAIATHYPHPDHVEDFARHMRLVVETVSGADGLLSFDCWRDDDGRRLFGVSRWASRADFESALPAIGANRDRRRAEWTIADDELLLLSEL